MSKNTKLRKRSFVDTPIQGSLALRVVLYWIVCIIDIALTLIFWRVGASGTNGFNPAWGAMWSAYWPILATLLLLLPLVIFDIIRFSNRFVGPILRLRRSMRQLARGEHVEPIKFRGTDFWQEFADEFNAVLARVQDRAAEVDKFAPESKRELVAVAGADC
jgi:hypothetical protein